MGFILPIYYDGTIYYVGWDSRWTKEKISFVVAKRKNGGDVASNNIERKIVVKGVEWVRTEGVEKRSEKERKEKKEREQRLEEKEGQLFLADAKNYEQSPRLCFILLLRLHPFHTMRQSINCIHRIWRSNLYTFRFIFLCMLQQSVYRLQSNSALYILFTFSSIYICLPISFNWFPAMFFT